MSALPHSSHADLIGQMPNLISASLMNFLQFPEFSRNFQDPKTEKTTKKRPLSGPVHPQIQAGWNLGATERPLWIGMINAMVNTKNDPNR